MFTFSHQEPYIVSTQLTYSHQHHIQVDTFCLLNRDDFFAEHFARGLNDSIPITVLALHNIIICPAAKPNQLDIGQIIAMPLKIAGLVSVNQVEENSTCIW